MVGGCYQDDVEVVSEDESVIRYSLYLKDYIRRLSSFYTCLGSALAFARGQRHTQIRATPFHAVKTAMPESSRMYVGSSASNLTEVGILGQTLQLNRNNGANNGLQLSLHNHP
jgi:hypothetical protein